MQIFVMVLFLLLGACSQKENSVVDTKQSDSIVAKTSTDMVQASSSVATVTEVQIQAETSQNIQCDLDIETCNSLFPFLQNFYGPLSTFDVVGEMEIATGFKAVILRGTGPNPGSHKSDDFMKAESFGVFIVDSVGNHVLTLDIFPTRRMLDYSVKFGEHGDGYLTILGSGSSYGDEPMKRKYFYDLNSRKVLSVFTGGIDVNITRIMELNGAIYCIGNTDDKKSVIAKITFPQPAEREIESISTILNEKIEPILDAQKDGGRLVLTSESNRYVLTDNAWQKTKNPTPGKYQYQKEGFAGLPRIPFWVPAYRVQQQAVDVELNGEMHTFLVWNDKISVNGGGPKESGIYDIQGKTVKFYPLPQPSYELFRQLRPRRVEDGYSEKDTELETEIGAFQLDENRIRFGLAFYDGEGTTGIGGTGAFDLQSKKFEVTYLKDIADSSVYSILVEPDSIWLGLGGQPEGAVYSKGMTRINRNDNSLVQFKTPGLVNTIVRAGTKVYVGTSNGVVIYADDGGIENFKLSINKDGGYSATISK